MDLVCLSHLRWDFVYQRPQHLMSRFARDMRVFYVEEPVLDAPQPHVEVNARKGVSVVKLHVPPGLGASELEGVSQMLLERFLADQGVSDYVLWYYSPMLLGFTRHFLKGARAIVYDCMDELSHFWLAPAELRTREAELFKWADLVFTGGVGLYELKRRSHPNVHAFPSSVDAEHFAQARRPLPAPSDQVFIPTPRVGYYGVVDERMDFELLRGLAELRPGWQFVIVGEIVKIDLDTVPSAANLHFLGLKPYQQLPAYLSGWDVAMLPFARNLSTRYISPTKIPEYLAAGRPVVSTSIPDVVRTYAEPGLVHIADEPDDFADAINAAMTRPTPWRQVDAFLRETSWDRTWQGMRDLLAAELVNEATDDLDEHAAAST